MIRNLLALVVGLAAGMAVNMGLVLLNAHVLYPLPEGADLNDPEQLNAWIATLPTAAFFVVLTAHLGQAFVGGWVAARLAASRPMRLALAVGVVSLIGGVVALRTIDGPRWLVVELPLYLVVAWLAGRLATAKAPA